VTDLSFMNGPVDVFECAFVPVRKLLCHLKGLEILVRMDLILLTFALVFRIFSWNSADPSICDKDRGSWTM